MNPQIKRTSSALSEPSTSRQVDKQEISKKLLHNQALNGQERAYLVEILENLNYRKVEMKNRKVQVDARNLLASRTYSTQTDELINNDPRNTMNADNKKIESKKLAVQKIDTAVATDLMAQSFNKRRNLVLLERPLAVFVKEQYPLLFSNTEVKNEIDRIFYDGKCEEFLKNIEKYSPHILSLARDGDPDLLTTKQKMDSFETPVQKKYAEDVGALLVISTLMEEDRNFLKLADKDCSPGNYPYIISQAKKSELFVDNHLFRVFVEKTMLCEASDFKEAILCLIGSYFIFNIKYPNRNFNTLVAIEKLFLGANDTGDKAIDVPTSQIIRCVQLKWQAKSCS